jgi:hypothetical protein
MLWTNFVVDRVLSGSILPLVHASLVIYSRTIGAFLQVACLFTDQARLFAW